MYTQCQLKKGDRIHFAWIPSKLAIKGNYVKIKDNNGDWDDGWLVEATYQSKEDYLVKIDSDAYRHQRSMSDI